MRILATLLLAAAAANVQMGVAPDQPLAHVYVDDPLIIEFTSDEDVRFSATLEVVADFQDAPAIISLGPIQLRAHGTHWRAIDGIPSERGLYRIRAELDVGGEVTEETGTFCRVDRPRYDYFLPISIGVDAPTDHLLLAMKGISIRCVSVDAGLPELATHVDRASAMGFQVSVSVDRECVEDAEALAKGLSDRVHRWLVDPGDSPETFAAITESLRRGGARGAILLVVRDPETVWKMLHAGVGQSVSGLVLLGGSPGPSNVLEMRSTAERAGYEGVAVCVAVKDNPTHKAFEGAGLLQEMLLRAAAGVEQTALNYEWIYGDDFGEGYVYLNAFARRLSDAVYVGGLDVPGGEAVVFRSGQQWTLVLWAVEDAGELSLMLENAAELAMYDARNNPLPLPRVADGTITLPLLKEPCFLVGKDGAILTHAAHHVARKMARAFVETQEFKECLPGEMIEGVGQFVQNDVSAYDQVAFFRLVRMFPRIEELWHSGALRRSVAVPAMASLARLARHMCVIQEERGEPFVEPLQNTLAICGQFQSLCLTSTTVSSDSHERPDWLLDEVSRLMAEAERLVAEGRPIEGSAVAALAEWRARALEFAVNAAPLSVPEPPPPEPVPEEAPPAEAPPADGSAPGAAPTAPPSENETEQPQAESAEGEPAQGEHAQAGGTAEEQYIIHVVVQGDNIYNLGKKYKVDLKEILKANNMKAGRILHLGDKLKIPKPPEQ